MPYLWTYDDRRGANALHAAKAGCTVAPAKAELHADVASEAARGCHHAGFNLDFLRLAIQLLDDAVNLRQNRRYVGDDQRVGAFVGDHISTLTQEFLDWQ